MSWAIGTELKMFEVFSLYFSMVGGMKKQNQFILLKFIGSKFNNIKINFKMGIDS
jgi:hypothetical protein